MPCRVARWALVLRGVHRRAQPVLGNNVALCGNHGFALAQVTFDPNQVSYEQLLEVLFQRHDPTQLNRQVGLLRGPCVISQWTLMHCGQIRATC